MVTLNITSKESTEQIISFNALVVLLSVNLAFHYLSNLVKDATNACTQNKVNYLMIFKSRFHDIPIKTVVS